MFSFIISLVALVVGYWLYGAFIERVFGADKDRPTPAVTKSDGVDFMVLPSWKIFMIQFLNIAGTGPIFGAIMGAKFGPVSYLWIVFGCIFAGATHDYLSGMLSIRHGGVGLPELVGNYLGNATKRVMLVFTVLLLIMVGAVFVYSPAQILGDLSSQHWNGFFSMIGFTSEHSMVMFWIVVVFVYYIIATMLPIDKIIGRIYPLFAISLIFMAVALMIMLFYHFPDLPEVWDSMGNKGRESGLLNQPIFPCLFITIACGAISGFHATQSPLMARCLKNEKQGRPIFYGAMITEGIVALVWATVASYFFYDNGYEVFHSSLKASAPQVVNVTANEWLGSFGAVLALLGVVAAPITSGDTALRSARLIIAEFVHLAQRTIKSRLLICIPLFTATMALLWYNITDADGFNIIWGYFGWANQTLAIFTLWTLTVYFVCNGKPFILVLLPALFMTAVCPAFLAWKIVHIDVVKSALGDGSFFLSDGFGYMVGLLSVIIALACFLLWYRNRSSYGTKI